MEIVDVWGGRPRIMCMGNLKECGLNSTKERVRTIRKGYFNEDKVEEYYL